MDPDHMVYGLVATGNKAGGFNDNFGTNGMAPTYQPERVTNFEIGSKNRFTLAGEPVKLNISAFYEAYHNQVLSSLLSIASAANFANSTGQPITFPSNFTPGAIIVNYNYNAASSTIAGTQFDGSITIPEAKMNIAFTGLWLPEAKVTASQSIEDFRFQSDIDLNDAGFRSIQDKRLPRTPRLQVNMQFSQKFETGLGTFDYVVAPGYRSSTYATIFNGQDYAYSACLAGGTVMSGTSSAQPVSAPVSGCSITTSYRGRLNDTIKGYATLDLGAGFSNKDGRLRIEGYVNNLLYKNQVTGLLISQAGGTVAFLPRPTTYGVRARIRF
jgi:iron complex outermembrane receptor protein